MDEREQRDCISGFLKGCGIRIKSMYCNPLTKVWQIDTDFEQIRFKPTPDCTPEECAEEFKSFLGLDEPVLEEEIDNLRLRTPDNILSAMERLRKIGTPAVEPLIKALLDESEARSFRARVADTLAMIGSREAVAPLIQTLNDPDVEVRWHAVQALASIGDGRAILPLEQMAATDNGSFSITSSLHVYVADDARKAILEIDKRMRDDN